MNDPKQVFNETSGRVAEVIAEYGEWYWLKELGQDQPIMVGKRGWPDLVPKTGDIWETPGPMGREYRVIGVDERLGQYLMIPRDDFYNTGWPTIYPIGGQIEVDIPDDTSVFVRRLPEVTLKLKARPK